MGNIVGIFIVGFIVLGVYKVFELLVRRKERLMFIEKFFTHCGEKKIADSFQLPDITLGNRDLGSWSLRISLLLMGVGMGCLLAFITACIVDWSSFGKRSNEFWELTIFSSISIFGGLGLLTAYLIESKQKKH
jgi:MFS family permease